MLDDSVLLGELAYVEFYDHREIGGTEPHEAYAFAAVGKVIQITDISISLHNWFFTNPDDAGRAHSSNESGFCIGKGLIKRIRLLGFVDDDEPPALSLVS